MNRTVVTIIITFALLFSGLSSKVSAWGSFGHRTIGEIAEMRLSEEAKAELRNYLGDTTLAEVATWADKVRRERPASAPLHFLNFPEELYTPRDEDLAREEGNVYLGTVGYAHRVINEELSMEERAEALKFLVHFAGDLHQPMHCGLASDRGGNDVRLEFMGQSSNLHRVWDSGLLEEHSEKDPADFARELLHGASEEALTEYAAVRNIRVWITESRTISKRNAYPMLKELNGQIAIGSDYMNANEPIARERLLMAGVRLGDLLERLLTDPEYVELPVVPVAFPPVAKPASGSSE